MSFRSFAGRARQQVSVASIGAEISQLRTLVVQTMWRDESGQNHQDLFEARCYADFAKPEDGKAFLDDQILANQDYVVRGLDLLDKSLRDYIETGVGFWLGAQIVAGAVSGGFACDLLTYRERYLTLDLYLRKKPDER